MSDQVIGIGIVGYGGFGLFVHEAWDSAHDVEVRAIADRDSSRAPRGGVRFTTEWRELLDDDAIDLIAVITPPASHAEIGAAVLAAGKHLLVDKPIATTLAGADKLIAERDKSGKVAAVNFMLRFNPLVQQLAQLAQSGLLGKLRHVAVENVAQDDTLPPNIGSGIRIFRAVFSSNTPDISSTLLTLLRGKRPHWYGVRAERETLVRRISSSRSHSTSGIVATHYHEFSRPLQLETTTIRFVFDLAQFDIDGWIPLIGTVHALAGGSS